MEKELLKWSVKVPRKDLFSKRSIFVMLSSLFLILLLSLVIPHTVQGLALLIGIIMIGILFFIFIGYTKVTLTYIITNNGIAKGQSTKNGHLKLSSKIWIAYRKFKASLFSNRLGTPTFMPFKAVSKCLVEKDRIRLLPKFPLLVDFVVITQNNKEKVLKLLQKQIKNTNS